MYYIVHLDKDNRIDVIEDEIEVLRIIIEEALYNQDVIVINVTQDSVLYRFEKPKPSYSIPNLTPREGGILPSTPWPHNTILCSGDQINKGD